MKPRDVDLMQRRAMRYPRVAGDTLSKTEIINTYQKRLVMLDLVKDPFQFDGMPIWLAAVQVLGNDQNPLPYVMWSEQRRGNALVDLADVVNGVGKPERQRLFRSHDTLYLARMISSAEWEQLPVSTFHDADPWKPKRGPVEVLEENWPGRPGAYPCSLVKVGSLEAQADCGHCHSCLDRATYESERQRVAREKAEREAAEKAYEAFLASDQGQAWVKEQDQAARERGDY